MREQGSNFLQSSHLPYSPAQLYPVPLFFPSSVSSPAKWANNGNCQGQTEVRQRKCAEHLPRTHAPCKPTLCRSQPGAQEVPSAHSSSEPLPPLNTQVLSWPAESLVRAES